MFGINIKKVGTSKIFSFVVLVRAKIDSKTWSKKGWFNICTFNKCIIRNLCPKHSLTITRNRLCSAKSLFTRSQMHICNLKMSPDKNPFCCSLSECILSHLSTINKLFPRAILNIQSKKTEQKGKKELLLFVFCNATALNSISELTFETYSKKLL